MKLGGAIGRARALCVAVTCVLGAAGATQAQDKRDVSGFMSDSDIRAAIVGQAMAGHYADGRLWGEDYKADGSLQYREAGKDVAGYWTLDSGVFCTLYHQQLGGGCWRVRQVSRNCFEFHAARSGADAAGASTTWTARGWKTAEAPGCGAPQIS